jgi:hypothetical protein
MTVFDPVYDATLAQCGREMQKRNSPERKTNVQAFSWRFQSFQPFNRFAPFQSFATFRTRTV